MENMCGVLGWAVRETAKKLPGPGEAGGPARVVGQVRDTLSTDEQHVKCPHRGMSGC